MRKYRLTLLFAITALVAIAVAALITNRVTGDLAENNLIRIAEENTARDGLHMEAMMRREHHMSDMQQPVALTLDQLVGPEGLDIRFPTLVEGLNVVKFNVFDLNGTTVWSTDANTIGITKTESPLFGKAAAGGTASKFAGDREVVHLDGVTRRIDVVETYLPLREARQGNIIGVMEIYRDVADDVAIQVDDAKAAVLWTTLATMGGLFAVLLGFVVVADLRIYRSNRREVAFVEDANHTLEVRVRDRTQELEDSSRQLLEAQEHLVRTEKLSAFGQLAGGVAHDLRSPLGAINNAVYYLKERLGSEELAQSNPKVPEFLNIIQGEVQHSNEIISDLLTFARVNTPSLSPTDLGATIRGALSSLELKETVHLVERLDPDLPKVMADGEQLHRVFTNLALNAQDAMPD